MDMFIELDNWEMENQKEFLSWLKAEAELNEYYGFINWIFIGNEEIAEINIEHLGHKGPTDVISFNLEDEEEDFGLPLLDADIPEISGEIYVSLERALEQSTEYNVTLTEEISRLALHGLLHLSGYDDVDDRQRSEMRKREDDGLKRASGDGELPWTVRQSDNRKERQ